MRHVHGRRREGVRRLPGAALSTIDPELAGEAVRLMGLASGFEWDLEEARAISDQLQSIREGLRIAGARLDQSGYEPATSFEVGR